MKMAILQDTHVGWDMNNTIINGVETNNTIGGLKLGGAQDRRQQQILAATIQRQDEIEMYEEGEKKKESHNRS